MTTHQDNLVTATRAIMEKYADVKLHEITPGNEKAFEVAEVPEGKKLVSLKQFQDEYRTAPERRKGTASLKDLASFIAHTKRFSDDDSALFANNDPEKPSLTCVFNYHRQKHDGDPRFSDHKAYYAFPLSDEWQAWNKKNGSGNRMSQIDFAEFLEDRISDVIQPDPEKMDEKLKDFARLLGGDFASPSKLVELSRGLAVHEGAQVKNAYNTSTGEGSIQFVTEHKDANGQPLKVPNLFLIAIPVFKAGPLYQIAVRLRYRLQAGTIHWFYELYRTDKVFKHAFDEACEVAKNETSLPLFIGSQEA